MPNQAPGLTGLDLWNVSNPAHPRHLGFYDVGPSGGVHELSLTKRVIAGQARVFALAAVPFAEVISTAFTPTPRGDFQLIDVTDPRNPTLADDWGAGKDGGLPYGAPFFADFGFSPPFDCTPPPGQEPTCPRGYTLYLSWYSDGLRIVDISNPASPQEVGFFREQPTPDPTGFFGPNFGAGDHPIQQPIRLVTGAGAGLHPGFLLVGYSTVR